MTELQWHFLDGEFLTLTINGALQRSSTYATESDHDRETVRRKLKSNLREIAKSYSAAVGEEQHIRNIQELASRLNRDCARFLNGGCLRFGIAQKALNLYLKYLWCPGRIPLPPHCPFDDRVINGVNGKGKLDLPEMDSG